MGNAAEEDKELEGGSSDITVAVCSWPQLMWSTFQNTVCISRKGIQTIRGSHLITLVIMEAQGTHNFQDIRKVIQASIRTISS
jgi:hypothetical protein